MTDTDLGAELSPAEESYFESGGATELPETGGEQAADTTASGGQPGGGDEGATQQPKVEKMVSLAALHEERTRRKEIDRQNRELQQQVAEMRGKFAVIDRLTTAPPEPEPTVDTDIFGVVKNTTTTVADLKKRMDDREAAEKASREETDQRNGIIAAYHGDAVQFAAQNPDFQAAQAHLLKSRAEELQALGYTDRQAIQKALHDDEMAVVQMAIANGRSPAEVIYNLARQRGYVKGANARGRDRLDTIERGSQANKSFNNTGGGSGDSEMIAEALLKMPMDEFETWCAKNPQRAKRIMGG